MAIEILLETGRTFRHHLRHDLESVLFVIIWICVHMEGPEVERKDVKGLEVRKWCDMKWSLKDLGHLKQAHVDDAQRTILPEFTSYWEDFKPFVHRLIRAFFPARACDPNQITSDIMISILEDAEKDVKEPSLPGPSMEFTDETEMYKYKVLRYGKVYRQGQEEAPRKRIKTSKPRSQSPSARPRSSRAQAGGPSRGGASKLSKLCHSASESQGQSGVSI